MSSGPGKTISAGEYARRHEEDSGFEAICAAARQNCVIRFLRKFTPTSILEVGTGPWSLSSRVRREGLIFDSWVIVEPAEAFAKAERARLAGDDRFVLVDGFVELERETIRACCQDGFDAVIVSGVIHETRHPEALLESAISLLKTGGRMLVNSPNALSFHRLLAVASNLISAPDMLSERNVRLGQPIVFTPESLHALLENAGLTDLEFEGYLFKPFTHDQMAIILPQLESPVISGLEELGRKFPHNSAEISYTGRKK